MSYLRKFAGGSIAALLLSTGVLAQGTIQQSGPAISGNPVVFISNGVVMSAGPASGGGVGQGIGELLGQSRGVGNPPYANSGSGPLGTNICDYDGPITNPTGYHFLCMSANAQGGGLIAYGYSGGASPLPFHFYVNGILWPGINAFRLISTGLTDTAVAGDGIIAWKSASTGPKLETIGFACDAFAQGYPLTIVDDSPTDGAGTDPITIVPNGSDTIRYYPVWTMNFDADDAPLVCDGAGNWIVKG